MMRAYGKLTIAQKAAALDRLGDLAAPHIFINGELTTLDIGSFSGGINMEFLKIYTKGSIRLRTPLNDIKPRNMGANGQIFDPVLQPGFPTVMGGSVLGLGAYVGYNVYQAKHGR